MVRKSVGRDGWQSVLIVAVVNFVGFKISSSRLKLPGGGTPSCDLNGDVRPDRVWFSGCFVLNGVSISSLSVLNRVLLHCLMA